MTSNIELTGVMTTSDVPLSLTGTRITDNMIIFTREPTTRDTRTKEAVAIKVEVTILCMSRLKSSRPSKTRDYYQAIKP